MSTLEKKAKSGLDYISGRLNVEWKEYNVSMFNNDKQGNDARPDFNIVIEPSEGQANQNSNNSTETPAPKDNQDYSEWEVSVEDLPF